MYIKKLETVSLTAAFYGGLKTRRFVRVLFFVEEIYNENFEQTLPVGRFPLEITLTIWKGPRVPLEVMGFDLFACSRLPRDLLSIDNS